MKMQKNLIIAVVITAVVAGGADICAGARPGWLGASPIRPVFSRRRTAIVFSNSATGPTPCMGGTAKRIQGNGMIAGEIISKDDKTITLKDRAGGSKIVFFSDKTAIAKTTDGALADLTVGAIDHGNGT